MIKGKMDRDKVSAVLCFVLPRVLEQLMKERKIGYREAAEIFYETNLYRLLEAPETGLWRLSAEMLYTLLCEELTTGKITFPEEQS